MASAIKIPASSIIVMNKKADIVRVYLPPDANTLLWVTDHCLRTEPHQRHRGGQAASAAMADMDEAVVHCTAGHRHLGLGQQRRGRRARRRDGLRRRRSDTGDAGGGRLLRKHFPDLKIRVVNVVDLMTLQPKSEHPHGLTRSRISMRCSPPTSR